MSSSKFRQIFKSKNAKIIMAYTVRIAILTLVKKKKKKTAQWIEVNHLACPGTFRPKTISSPSRFAPKTFPAPRSFPPWSFRTPGRSSSPFAPKMKWYLESSSGS